MMRLASVSPLILASGVLLSASAHALSTPEVRSVDWDKANTVRVGDSINTVYRITMSEGSQNNLWLNVDCQTQTKTLLYMNLHTLTGSHIRAYAGNSFARYIPSVPFEPDADSLMSTDPALNVCKQNVAKPRWVGLAAADKHGDQPFIDLSNSHRQDNMLNLRIGTDYAQIHREKQYDAPYDFKISQMQVNCDNQQARVERTFSLNSAVVTDNAIPAETAFSSLPSSLIAPMTKLCALQDLNQFTGSGALVARQKTEADAPLAIPDFEHNDPSVLARYPLPETVSKTVKGILNNGSNAPTFSRLTFTPVWPGDADINGKTRIDRLPDGSTLMLDTLVLKGVTFYSQYHRLFNIVDLKQWDSMKNSPLIAQKLETNFSAMPKVGQPYRWHAVLRDDANPENSKSKSQDCRVEGPWRDASTLNEAFKGRYIELICTDDRGDGRAMSSDYAWLEDLRVFIRIGYQEAGQKKRFTFKDVTIIR
ncbi:hypothetical protein [Kluyvera ascorbata]|uniref:hypothetical protein n=1 Tax=Kluyvera ascorbata TaxID=51288 RepID=UPI0004E34474|nr:hypothetical protein [Kluyvera ascorbata]EJG2387699.1 hypothetical protein [Kluyvera ascorbata]KFC99034.1 hypothetical protein GKAS_03561 [Kluyvera ascorbata ATCC 33433]MDU1198628.1 hypothetical protein [Kluyvera ascorbata]STX01191.1 Uncharacterised protein [Kluyvera ascorbata]BCA41348.1 hypothetical protein KATP_38700 [Kluyvera ascorbata]